MWTEAALVGMVMAYGFIGGMRHAAIRTRLDRIVELLEQAVESP